jgi:hypothetical protein
MPSDRYAFIVRLWLEDSQTTQESPRLRGSIQAATGDTIHYFTSFDDLPHLLRELSNLDETAGPNPSQHHTQ